MTTKTKPRPLDIDGLTLKAGAHEPDGKFCVMEAVAYVAGEPWSDHPACVSPVLGAFLRAWNDGLDDETRQRLKPYIPRVIGTAGDAAADERRAWLATDWLVRVCAPAFLDLAGLDERAAELRSLQPLDGSEAARLVQPRITQASKEASAARDAAWAAARDAARDAAWDAAWDAARAAAWAAAWTAARDAAWAAARDAARDAAWDAAWAAAWDAAWDALAPTVADLQQTAFDLLDRMVDAA